MTTYTTRDALMGLGRQFMDARVVFSAAQLDLFTLLSQKPQTVSEVTRAIGGDERATRILLDAVVALGLLTKSAGRYHSPPAVAELLSSTSPASARPMVLHWAALWPSWTELTGFVRGDSEAIARAHVPQDAAATQAFIGAMDVVARPLAERMAAAIAPHSARKLLDIGGGPGTYTRALLQAAPHLHATLFDLPPVIEMARERLTQAGLADRVTFAPGDFYRDDLPPGHDLALLSAIIHQNSRAQNVALYRKALAALAPGGRLVIRDHIMNADRTEPKGGAIFAVNMLVRTDGGDTFTFDEIRADLEQAGFARIRQFHPSADFMDGLVEAFRP